MKISIKVLRRLVKEELTRIHENREPLEFDDLFDRSPEAYHAWIESYGETPVSMYVDEQTRQILADTSLGNFGWDPNNMRWVKV